MMRARLFLPLLLAVALAACDSITPPLEVSTIEVVRVPRDTTLRFGRDTLRLPLTPLFSAETGAHITYSFAITEPAGGAFNAQLTGRNRDTLSVAPWREGTGRVTVTALLGRERATATFLVSSTNAWCPAPPPGYVDYAQLRDGQTLTFAYSKSSDGGNGVQGVQGTSTWRLRGGCEAGVLTLTVEETGTGIGYTTIPTVPRDTTKREPVTWTTQHRIVVTSTTLAITTGSNDAYSFRTPVRAFEITPFRPATSAERVTMNTTGPPCRTDYVMFELTRTRGIEKFGASQSCHQFYSGEFWTRQP